MPLHPGFRQGYERRGAGGRDPGPPVGGRCPYEAPGFAAIQSTIETPWGIAVTDFVYPATCGTRPADLAQCLQYGMALTKLTAQDPGVRQLTAEVSQLLKPQAVLREPALADVTREAAWAVITRP
ncbi:hypothetical protein SAMN05443247_00463 [Bradyrhizobium erythrophlei]|jgi:hypothetical protein|nr:hypothetical protein SAMN05443247_00463 [Bradyrhizobium erythrophlei]